MRNRRIRNNYGSYDYYDSSVVPNLHEVHDAQKAQEGEHIMFMQEPVAEEL